MSKIQFKMNDKGSISILCSRCGKDLKTALDFTEKERKSFRNEIYMPPQDCETLLIPCKKYENSKHRTQ